MQRKTIEAISRNLYQEFGSGHQIYVDASVQNLTEPCFYICPLSAEHVQRLGTVYRRNQSFDIHYFPIEEERPSKELSDTAERLYSCMEYIFIEGKTYRGTDMKSEIQDGVLHFTVDYNIPLRKLNEPDPYMEELEVKGSVQ